MTVDVSERLYLRPDVIAEPLIDQWYAWSHLISPGTAARNITHRHLPIMDSYTQSPGVHAAAVKNPAMLGGPFMDYPQDCSAAIGRLRQSTTETRADLIALSEALGALDTLLAEHTGDSLEPLYHQLPEPLDGFVELFYDLNNHASYRLIEPLLYQSEYGSTDSQSIFLSLADGDHRPFILSTPRLPSASDVHLKIPFSHPGLDVLFSMARTPRSFAELKEALGFDDRFDARMRDLLTTEAPRAYARYNTEDAGGIHARARWRYFGHACVLVETSSCSILTDPVLSYACETGVPRYTYDDLPDRIDYVLITHNHQDHILIETMLRLRHRIGTVVVPRSGNGALQDPSVRLMLESIGFDNVVELAEFQQRKTPMGSILGLPFLGEHGDLHVATKMAWVVEVDSYRLVFAADCSNLSPAMYRRVRDIIGDTDVLFLGMECDGAPVSWIYGPLFTKSLARKYDHQRRLAGSDYDRARSLVDIFGCREAYVYAMGQEPWLNYIMSKKYTAESRPIVDSNRLLDYCASKGILAERLFGEREMLLEDDGPRAKAEAPPGNHVTGRR